MFLANTNLYDVLIATIGKISIVILIIILLISLLAFMFAHHLLNKSKDEIAKNVENALKLFFIEEIGVNKVGVASSPIKLNDKGNKILDCLGLRGFLDENREDIFNQMDKNILKFDLNNKLLPRIVELFSTEEKYKNKRREVSYECGKSEVEVLSAIYLYLRELYIKDFIDNDGR